MIGPHITYDGREWIEKFGGDFYSDKWRVISRCYKDDESSVTFVLFHEEHRGKCGEYETLTEAFDHVRTCDEEKD